MEAHKIGRSRLCYDICTAVWAGLLPPVGSKPLGKALKTSQIMIYDLGTCTDSVAECMTARQSVGFVESLDADFASR